MLPSPSLRPTAAALTCATALLTLSGCSGDATGSDTTVRDRATVAGTVVRRDAKLHGLLPGAVKKSGTVRVATDIPYPPFEMFAAPGSDEMTGLDYDLGQALGAKLGVRFAFSAQKFDGIVPALQAGKFDVAMSAITDNKDRQRVVDFVDYTQSGSAVMVAQGNPRKIRTLDDLCGRKVGVQAATNQLKLLTAHQAACAKAGRPKTDIQTFPKDSDAQLALRSGKVVADVLTKPAAGWTARTADRGRAFDLVEDPKAPGGYGASPNGIAVSKKLPALTTAIQKALQALMDDGTLTKICEKYGIGSIALTKATRNAAVD
ncbi:ABC transporter substrate-binding protein [Streptomyces sp. NPDC005925]|uniref:ABC transporter substrate-binding protein n=1 Tax=Streptomyces sp. NPDC005925 TaxID=3157172 RepID=UPI0033EBC1C6